jgi:hypothetical protein
MHTTDVSFIYVIYYKKIYDTHSSPIRVMKSRGMRWTGHVARMRERRGTNMDLVGKPEG